MTKITYDNLDEELILALQDIDSAYYLAHFNQVANSITLSKENMEVSYTFKADDNNNGAVSIINDEGTSYPLYYNGNPVVANQIEAGNYYQIFFNAIDSVYELGSAGGGTPGSGGDLVQSIDRQDGIPTLNYTQGGVTKEASMLEGETLTYREFGYVTKYSVAANNDFGIEIPPTGITGEYTVVDMFNILDAINYKTGVFNVNSTLSGNLDKVNRTYKLSKYNAKSTATDFEYAVEYNDSLGNSIYLSQPSAQSLLDRIKGLSYYDGQSEIEGGDITTQASGYNIQLSKIKGSVRGLKMPQMPVRSFDIAGVGDNFKGFIRVISNQISDDTLFNFDFTYGLYDDVIKYNEVILYAVGSRTTDAYAIVDWRNRFPHISPPDIVGKNLVSNTDHPKNTCGVFFDFKTPITYDVGFEVNVYAASEYNVASHSAVVYSNHINNVTYPRNSAALDVNGTNNHVYGNRNSGVTYPVLFLSLRGRTRQTATLDFYTTTDGYMLETKSLGDDGYMNSNVFMNASTFCIGNTTGDDLRSFSFEAAYNNTISHYAIKSSYGLAENDYFVVSLDEESNNGIYIYGTDQTPIHKASNLDITTSDSYQIYEDNREENKALLVQIYQYDKNLVDNMTNQQISDELRSIDESKN